jgi:predicted RNA methylase
MNYAGLCLEKALKKSSFIRNVWSYAFQSGIREKEIREAFDFVQRIDSLTKGKNVLELCSGHGLIGHLLAMKGAKSVRQVDRLDSKSRGNLERYLKNYTRVIYDNIDFIVNKDEILTWDFDIVVSMHACGNLTDEVIDIAMKKGADIASCPCCYHGSKVMKSMSAAAHHLGKPLAVDAFRLGKLANAGYDVSMKLLEISISPCNHIIVGKKIKT